MLAYGQLPFLCKGLAGFIYFEGPSKVTVEPNQTAVVALSELVQLFSKSVSFVGTFSQALKAKLLYVCAFHRSVVLLQIMQVLEHVAL